MVIVKSFSPIEIMTDCSEPIHHCSRVRWTSI